MVLATAEMVFQVLFLAQPSSMVVAVAVAALRMVDAVLVCLARVEMAAVQLV